MLLKTAQTVADKTENLFNVAFTLVASAKVYISKGNFELAEGILEKARDIYETILESEWTDEKIISMQESGWSDYNNLMTLLQLIQIELKQTDSALITAETERALAYRLHIEKITIGIWTKSYKQFPSLYAMEIYKSAISIGVQVIVFSAFIHETRVCWIFPKKTEFSSTPNKREISDYNLSEFKVIGNDNETSNNTCNSTLKNINLNFNHDQPSNSRKFHVSKISAKNDVDLVPIWKLIEPNLCNDGTNRVVVICDREICTAPLCSINIDGVPLLEKHIISFSPSISSLVAKWKIPTFSEDIALLLGNPTSDLTSAEEEVNSLETLFQSNNWRTEKITRESSLIRQVIDKLSKCKIFHIASHGTIENKSNNLYPGDLVLYNNERIYSDEIHQMDLRNLELAFLHCCFTGNGKIYTEGLMGLGRAFLFAGARAVIVSRQSVPDNKFSVAFANKFYDELLRGKLPDVALTLAQRFLKDSGAPEEHWGSYFALIQMQK